MQEINENIINKSKILKNKKKGRRDDILSARQSAI